MTCIVAFTDGKKVTIVGDSAGTGGTEQRIRKDKKVFSHGEFIFGGTHSFRMLQLLKYSWEPPLIPDDMKLMKYMVSLLVPSIIKIFKEHEFYGKDSDGRAAGIGILVGVRGRIFSIENDFQVAETFEKYESIGCGREVAIGSLATSFSMHGEITKETAILALEVTSKFDCAVAAPFVSVTTP